jgi:hypothetical protein
MNKRLCFSPAGVALAVFILAVSCMANQGEKTVAIEQVKEKYESKLMDIKGVVGVGIGSCESKPCIEVYLENESPALKEKIPNELEGFKVGTEVTGSVKALPKSSKNP